MTASARAGADEGLRFLPGIGPAKAAALAEAGFTTVWHLLHAVPRLLGPPPPLCERGPLEPGSEVRVRARVLSARPLFMRGRGMAVQAALERADGAAVKAVFFHAGWLRRHLVPNEWYLWEGRVDAVRAGVLVHPTFVHLAAGAATALPAEPAVRVAYRAPAGMSERVFAKLVESVLATHLGQQSDPIGELPDADYQALIRSAHAPADAADHERVRLQLARRELTALAWLLQSRRARHAAAAGRAWAWSDEIDRRARARLPFSLTAGQESALAAIRADLRQAAPMCRLLQGDVGSGKTALALLACLAVVAEGAQAFVLAPTSVLAAQHHAFFTRCLAGSRVRLGLLTGATRADERTALLAELAARRLDLLIGTHAVIEEGVRAAELGLAVIDEQHKFGVEQRAALVAKASSGQSYRPDVLLLTATPIPRTLALTVFGDLAVSRIAGRPPGRGVVTTEVAHLAALDGIDEPLRAALAAGGRAFVVCPLKEESREAKAFAVAAVHRHLCARFPEQVAIIHGDRSDEEKSEAISAFAHGDVRILVTTTVIEVGIDIPAATLVLVLDADRFGLASLHQLRGRIGRGASAGRCVLYHRSLETPARLTVLANSDDGLAIAEADLAARGPGELLGTTQHGAFTLRLAELPRDLDLLQDAHESVKALLARGAAMPDGLKPFLPSSAVAELLRGG